MPPSAICGMLPSADRLYKGLSSNFLHGFSAMRVSGRHPQFRRQGVNETPCTIKFFVEFFNFWLFTTLFFSGRTMRGAAQKQRTALGNIAESGQAVPHAGPVLPRVAFSYLPGEPCLPEWENARVGQETPQSPRIRRKRCSLSQANHMRTSSSARNAFRSPADE